MNSFKLLMRKTAVRDNIRVILYRAVYKITTFVVYLWFIRNVTKPVYYVLRIIVSNLRKIPCLFCWYADEFEQVLYFISFHNFCYHGRKLTLWTWCVVSPNFVLLKCHTRMPPVIINNAWYHCEFILAQKMENKFYAFSCET